MTHRPLRAGIYTRLSRDRSGEQTATARQEADCRKLVDLRGWDVVEPVFTDVDLSAFKGTARPGFEALVAELQAGGIDVVVAWKLDRLLRRPRDFERIWQLCEEVGAQIITVADGIDTSQPMAGTLVPRIMATFAELEGENLSVRAKRKHEEIAKAGRRAGGGSRPFGLTADWSALVDAEARLVREAAERIIAGDASMYAIAAEWNDAGVTTPTGRPWSTQHVRSMLLSPRLAGERDHLGQRYATGAIPAIITPEQHARLVAAITRRGGRGNGGARFLLSGLLRCSECGSTLVVRRRHKDKRRFYGCEKVPGKRGCGRVHIVAEPLEKLVVEILFEAVASEELVERIRQREADSRTAIDLDALAADEASLEELSRDYYVDHRIGRAEFFGARDALEARIQDARGRLATRNGSDRLHALQGGRDRLEAEWATHGLEWQRHLLTVVIDHVRIAPASRRGSPFEPDRATPIWRY